MRRSDREIKDHNQIRQVLDVIKTCRLAMVDGGMPYVIPLSFGYALEDGVLSVYFHSAKDGRKIDVLRENSSVCFEMSTEGEAVFDEATPCDYGYYFSSVIGFGNVEFVEEFAEKAQALSILTKHQAGIEYKFSEAQTDTVCVFKVVTPDFTGKLKPGRHGPHGHRPA
ncbi:MAG: pyridoxamine 5'-phosphate oxidase family protein [Oscillospiraceae bacterium]|nr:pyridoxamine 5'-phosphate oxidase family protein [Oscillospiraceae bacterium]